MELAPKVERLRCPWGTDGSWGILIHLDGNSPVPCGIANHLSMGVQWENQQMPARRWNLSVIASGSD